MDTHQSQHERPRRRDHWTGLPRVLLTLIILSLVVITVLLLMIVQPGHGPNGAKQHPTPPPVVSGSPTSTPSPSHSPTPSPPPSPSPTPAPSPTPSPPPGVLGYPLYSGNPRLPEIALTFDDGPNPAYTSQILAILQQYNVQATFFVIGSQAAAYPDLVQQESQQGNIVGNHTWTHPNLTKLPPANVRDELQRTSQEIQADTSVAPTLLRPPGGNFNRSVQSSAASLGLSTILWNVDPRDWSRPGTSVIIQRILTSTHNGSIILMHDGGGNRSETVAALPTIITTLEQRGFQFVTIPRMIQNLPPDGTGPTQISPDQLSLEGAFRPCLTFPRILSSRWLLSTI